MRPTLTTLNTSNPRNFIVNERWRVRKNNQILSISIHSIQPKSEHKANDKQKNKKKLTKDSNSTWVHIKDLLKKPIWLEKEKEIHQISNSAVPNYFIYIYILIRLKLHEKRNFKPWRVIKF